MKHKNLTNANTIQQFSTFSAYKWLKNYHFTHKCRVLSGSYHDLALIVGKNIPKMLSFVAILRMKTLTKLAILQV